MPRTFLQSSSAPPADSDWWRKLVNAFSSRCVEAAEYAWRLIVPIVLFLVTTLPTAAAVRGASAQSDLEQVPTWSAKDMDFFLHGSMSAEVIPENVLRAFIKTYPDLFATSDLTHLGLVPDPEFGWPVGLSRANIKHLGGLPSLGINCASCHFAQVTSKSVKQPIRVFGTTKGVARGELHKIDDAEVRQSFGPDIDLAERAHGMLKLFHNMRAALHVPDQPPDGVPPSSGPGRNDAFGLLAAALLNLPQPYSPIKFGLVWNVEKRTWVHWDGNTKSPIARNLLASLGLGAPLHGKRADLQFESVKRQTDLTEKIRPPRYPFPIDRAAAQRGEPLFASNCNSCHGGPETDKRLYSVAAIGTDPNRANMFTQKLADGFNTFLAELEAEGYQPPKEAEVRSTGKYFAATLSAVWARSPYLHNGSIRTMHDLLTPPQQRERRFHRGSREFDESAMGYTDEGAYLLDTSASGNSNSGHDYGTKLTIQEKHDLIEYLKTL